MDTLCYYDYFIHNFKFHYYIFLPEILFEDKSGGKTANQEPEEAKGPDKVDGVNGHTSIS